MFNFWNTPLGRLMRGLPASPPPLWRPTYIPVAGLTVSEPNNAGGQSTQPLNPQDYPDLNSASYLASLYTAKLTMETLLGAGPDSTAGVAIEYTLNWTDAATGIAYKVHAGTLAYYYQPAGQEPAPATLDNPDNAAVECRAAITAARLDALRAGGIGGPPR